LRYRQFNKKEKKKEKKKETSNEKQNREKQAMQDPEAVAHQQPTRAQSFSEQRQPRQTSPSQSVTAEHDLLWCGTSQWGSAVPAVPPPQPGSPPAGSLAGQGEEQKWPGGRASAAQQRPPHLRVIDAVFSTDTARRQTIHSIPVQTSTGRSPHAHPAPGLGWGCRGSRSHWWEGRGLGAGEAQREGEAELWVLLPGEVWRGRQLHIHILPFLLVLAASFIIQQQQFRGTTKGN